MYHTIIPVTREHNPIVIEGQIETRVLIFNAGPSTVQAQVWQNWKSKRNDSYSDNSDEPTLNLELRVGNQKIVSGSFIRIKLKDISDSKSFAAIGIRILLSSLY